MPNSQLRATQQRLEDDHKRQVEQIRHAADVESERYRRRSEAEVADLRATISRLEVDLMKVCSMSTFRISAEQSITSNQTNKSKAQEVHSIREDYTKQLAEKASTLENATARTRELEKRVLSETEGRKKVSNRSLSRSNTGRLVRVF